jgi:hypothetical protein
LVSTVNTKTVVDKTSVLEIRSQRLNDAVDAELAALRRVMETSPSRNWIRPQNRNRTTAADVTTAYKPARAEAHVLLRVVQ